MPKYYTMNKELEIKELTKEEYNKQFLLMGFMCRGNEYKMKCKKPFLKKLYITYLYCDNELIQVLVHDYEEKN